MKTVLRTISRSGVIEVMHRARAAGYVDGSVEWANLGQGAPETGRIPDGIERIDRIEIDSAHHAYAPVSGVKELRAQIATVMNEVYRTGKTSQYTWENVSVVSGGRAALARIFASLNSATVGFFTPDYASYEGLLTSFCERTVPIDRSVQNAYTVSANELRSIIEREQLDAVLTSNPCNPTGAVIAGQELEQLVGVARETNTALFIDEFYSAYVYKQQQGDQQNTVSAASYIDDVNEDPVLIVNGLTKNWRYPGWRVAWIIGPIEMIQTLDSVGSFIDGGSNHPAQAAALPVVNTSAFLQEAVAIQKHFSAKRDYVVKRCEELGIQIDVTPDGAFYVWANISSLPAPLNNALSFMEAALQERVICVPGNFFDLRTDGTPEEERAFTNYVRFSFGPTMDVLERGFAGIERMIKKQS